MDFFTQQEQVRKKVRLLVTYFILAVILIVLAISFVTYMGMTIYSGQPFLLKDWVTSSTFIYSVLGTLAIIGLGSLVRWLQIRGGGDSFAQMMNARRVATSTEDPLERRLLNVTEEMAIASGMPVPTVYIMDDESAINAMVAGLETSDTILMTTRGSIENLSRQELQGVVAHEFSHIFNGDMRLNVRLISILAGILVIGQTGRFLMEHMRFARIGDSDKAAGGVAVAMIAGLAMFVIGYIGMFFGRLIKANISRQREYLADASAVQYARDNDGIAGALMKAGQARVGTHLKTRHAEDASHMCFVEAVPVVFMSGKLSTHPPLEKRIKALKPNWKGALVPGSYDPQDPATESSANFATSQQRAQAGQDSAIDADDMVESVGNPTEQHIHFAGDLIGGLPLLVTALAHGARPERDSALLVLALLLSNQPSEETGAEELIIEPALSAEEISQLNTLKTKISPTGKQQRLAILDLALPGLKTLSYSQRTRLIAQLKQIIQSDKHIDQFEYVLYSLVRKSLNKKDYGARKVLKSFKPVTEELRLVIDAVVRSSDCEDAVAEQIFSQAMSAFGINSARPESKDFDADLFHNALKRLALLAPILKKTLLDTLADCVMHDNQVDPEEIEIVRAISEHLDCPMPPVLKTAVQQSKTSHGSPA